MSFHFIVVVCYILTAFFIFLLASRYFADKDLGLLAGTLFSVNYYIGFRALTWNCFHSHATNTLTGIITLYCLLRYLEERQKRFLAISAIFFLLTILNYESGFVFFPVIIIITAFYALKKNITLKKTQNGYLLKTWVLTKDLSEAIPNLEHALHLIFFAYNTILHLNNKFYLRWALC